MYYLKKNNKIVMIDNFKVGSEWQETDKEILWSYSKCSYVFAEEMPREEEEKEARIKEENIRNAEIQAEREVEALKPTTEDLVEALDILSAIVLGGAE